MLETTAREHAAMEAAGMTDEELEAVIRNRRTEQHLLVQVCADERETRAKCRFLEGRKAA